MADELTLTIRLHDPKEKTEVTMAASWAIVKVLRTDLTMPADAFIQKYIAPELKSIKNLKLT